MTPFGLVWGEVAKATNLCRTVKKDKSGIERRYANWFRGLDIVKSKRVILTTWRNADDIRLCFLE